MQPKPQKPVYVFLEATSGIGKNSGKPYNLLKAADPVSFENVLLTFDPHRTGPLDSFKRGDQVHIDIQAVNPYNQTQAVAYYVSKADKVS